MSSSSDNLPLQKESEKKFNKNSEINEDKTKKVEPEALGENHRKKLNSIIEEVKYFLKSKNN